MLPDDERALIVGRCTLALLDALGLTAATRTPATYDADHLPPGVKKRPYHERHARCIRSGADGWTRVGHARVVTVAAWEADVAAETSRSRKRPAVAPAANDVDTLDAALGIRTRRAAR